MLAAVIGLQRTHRKNGAIKDWVLALSCFCLSGWLHILVPITTLPAVLTPGIPNALYVCGHGLIFSGNRRHTRGKPGYKITVSVAVTTLVAH